MPDVSLNYDLAKPDTPFGPDPHTVHVRANGTIRFRIGDSTRAAHPNCKLRITFHRGQHFSQSVLQHSANQTGAEDLVVTVLPGVAALAASATVPHPVISGYRCELLSANGEPIPGLVADGDNGGESVLDT